MASLSSSSSTPSVPVAGGPSTGSESSKLGDVLNVFDVDAGMFAEHRAKLVARCAGAVAPGSVALLQGGVSPTRYESDHEPVFRQESNFAYLFGVKEPDVFGVVELDTGKSTLFFPELPEAYAIVMGAIRTADSFKAEYQVDEVKFAPHLLEHLSALQPSVLYTTRGFNADSGRYAREASFAGMEAFRVDNGVLYDALVDCRVVKTAKEVQLLKHINKVSSEAHCWVMHLAQPGMREFQLESLFQHWGYFRGGCRHQSYTSICGCGGNGSVLHYGHAGAPNDGVVAEGDMCLLDMGAEFRCYASDITCSFPVSGAFSADQRMVYEAVLAAQWGVMRAMRPGVSWIDMHELSYRIICSRLAAAGLLVGDVDDMMAVNLGAVFMPHGLGHFMGLDTHDVGGRPKGHAVQTRDGYRSLRCCLPLRAGMVITVEPGVYFNDFSLDKALADPDQARFIDAVVLERFRGFGGVRIEDDVLVTDDGIDNFTVCPRTVDDVEAVMNGTKDANSAFATYETTPLLLA